VSDVYDVAEVRRAEEALMATLPEGELMQRAARGLEQACVDILIESRHSVAGSAVTVLVGPGNNGGDALWAAAGLARRGAEVQAFAISDHIHPEGAKALVKAGGRIITARESGDDPHLVADLIVDGILGIGGRGALRPPADAYARAASASGAVIVAVDVPSGVDADTGAVADPDCCIEADVTVTFGCLKPGLIVAPGRFQVGEVVLVDIGLAQTLSPARCHVLDDGEIAECIPAPTDADYKYSRGVVGLLAGSASFRGAALLATGGARCGNAGMVKFVDCDERLSTMVVQQFWDVVTASGFDDQRVTAWAVGPGMGTGEDAQHLLVQLLSYPQPMVLDADALRIISQPGGRDAFRARTQSGAVTVLTPHEGEFAGLGFELSHGATSDRVGTVVQAARDLNCVVILKGPGTITAAPSGVTYIDDRGGAELGTAGSGDVLTGLMGAMLASVTTHRNDIDLDQAAKVAAAAVALHGIAGERAAQHGAPVTAVDILAMLPEAIADIRATWTVT